MPICDDGGMSTPELTPEQRAERIKVIIFDVDGVLTDGQLFFIPTGHDKDGRITAVETKGFAAHDGLGIAIGRAAGLRFGIITKRTSDTVAVRMRDLKVDHVHMGAHFKTEALAAIASAEGVGLDEIAYAGDDIIDLPPMRQVGFAVAVWNARDQVKREAHWITPSAGGHGAGRDLIDFVLTAQGRLEEAYALYLSHENKSTDIGSGGM